MSNKYTVRKNFFDEIEIEPALEGDPVSGFLFAILLVIGLGFLFFIFDGSGNLLRMIVRIFFTLMVLARCAVFLLFAHRSEREEDRKKKAVIFACTNLGEMLLWLFFVWLEKIIPIYASKENGFSAIFSLNIVPLCLFGAYASLHCFRNYFRALRLSSPLNDSKRLFLLLGLGLAAANIVYATVIFPAMFDF